MKTLLQSRHALGALRLRHTGGGKLFFKPPQLVFERGNDSKRALAQLGFIQAVSRQFNRTLLVIEESPSELYFETTD